MSGAVIATRSAPRPQPPSRSTINGSGFGASQGTGYVAFSDHGTNWGRRATAPRSRWTAGATRRSRSPCRRRAEAAGSSESGPAPPPRSRCVDSSAQVSDTGASGDHPDRQPERLLRQHRHHRGHQPGLRQLRRRRVQPTRRTRWPRPGCHAGRHRHLRRPDLHLAERRRPAQPDNILAAGQQILLSPARPGRPSSDCSVTSTNGDSSGPVTITYTDGTSTTATVAFNDWASGPAPDETAVATMPYRNLNGGGVADHHDVRVRHDRPARLVQDGGLDHLPRYQQHGCGRHLSHAHLCGHHRLTLAVTKPARRHRVGGRLCYQ